MKTTKEQRDKLRSLNVISGMVWEFPLLGEIALIDILDDLKIAEERVKELEADLAGTEEALNFTKEMARVTPTKGFQ